MISPEAIVDSWEYRYQNALENAARCRRLATQVASDERLCLGLRQLAEDYEELATWLRRR